MNTHNILYVLWKNEENYPLITSDTYGICFVDLILFSGQ